MLLLKMLRNIRQSLGRVLSIVSLVLMGVMVYTGMGGIIDNLARIGSEYFDAQNMADAWIYGDGITWRDIKKIADLPQVAQVQPGITLDITLKQYDDAVLRLHAQDGYNINRPVAVEGSMPEPGDVRSIAIAKSFADVYGISVGDSIYFDIDGSRVNMKVNALVIDPEYIYPIKDMSQLVPDPKSFAFAYVSTDAVWKEIYPEGKAYNTVCLKLHNKEQGDELEQPVKDILHFRMSSFLPRKDHPSGAMFETEIDSMRALIGAIPSIFFVVAALVTLTTLARMVETERTEIGIIKALGYSNFSVLLYYVSFAAIVALMGSALGIVTGTIIPKYMMGLYGAYFELPEYTLQIDSAVSLNATALALAFCLISAAFACRKALRVTPAQCMRPKAPKPGKRILLERIAFLWQRVNFSYKMIFRSIFRNKMRLIMCIVGVSLCTALIVTSFGMQDSMNSMLDTQNRLMFGYDLDVVFKPTASMPQRERLKKLAYVNVAEYQMAASATIFGTSQKNTAITILEDVFTTVLLIPGISALELPRGGAVVSAKLAEEAGITPGGDFHVQLLGEKRLLKIKCLEVWEDMAAPGVYVSRSTWRDLGRQYVPGTAHVILKTGTDKKAFREYMLDYGFVDTVVDREDSLETLRETMQMMQVEIVIFILAAGLLAFVVLYNLGLQNMFERMRELATLKVLGFYNKEVKRVVLRENILFTFMGSICGMPMGAYMLSYVAVQAGGTIDSFRPVINTPSYIYAVLLTFGFAISVNLILGGRFKKIDMVQSLKSIE